MIVHKTEKLLTKNNLFSFSPSNLFHVNEKLFYDWLWLTLGDSWVALAGSG